MPAASLSSAARLQTSQSSCPHFFALLAAQHSTPHFCNTLSLWRHSQLASGRIFSVFSPLPLSICPTHTLCRPRSPFGPKILRFTLRSKTLSAPPHALLHRPRDDCHFHMQRECQGPPRLVLISNIAHLSASLHPSTIILSSHAARTLNRLIPKQTTITNSHRHFRTAPLPATAFELLWARW